VRKDIVVKLMVLAVLCCIGCGDKSPKEKCADLIDVVCDRGVECIAGAAGMHDECVHAVEGALPCGNIKSVTATYDHCIDLLNEQSCGTLFPTDPATGAQTLKLPAECSGVLSTQSTSGEIGRVPHAAEPPAAPIDDVAVRARAVLESRRE